MPSTWPGKEAAVDRRVASPLRLSRTPPGAEHGARLLDLALTHGPAEVATFTLLPLSGGALRLSWRAAGTVLRGVFLGNTLPMMAMMAIAGWLCGAAPVRLCNTYGLDDQQTVGLALSWTAAIAAV